MCRVAWNPAILAEYAGDFDVSVFRDEVHLRPRRCFGTGSMIGAVA